MRRVERLRMAQQDRAWHERRLAREAFRDCDAPGAVYHFRRALRGVRPDSPLAAPLLWGVINACDWSWDYAEAADACDLMIRSGPHPFYVEKARALGPVFRALAAGGLARPGQSVLDPVEEHVLTHMPSDLPWTWVVPAWPAFLWSVDVPPGAPVAAPAWSAAVVTFAEVMEGRLPAPNPPTLHYAALWRALAPEGDAQWLMRYADGRHAEGAIT